MRKSCAVLTMAVLVLAAAWARAGSSGDCSCPTPSCPCSTCRPAPGGCACPTPCPCPAQKCAPCCAALDGASAWVGSLRSKGCACAAAWDQRWGQFCCKSEKVRDWLTYCPERTKCCCCQCAEPVPHLYEFFLDHCNCSGDYALAPVVPPEPPNCSNCHGPLLHWRSAGCDSCGGWLTGLMGH
jgi:hypothetical protein